MEERLQKIISASGLMSRRAAEELIKAGKVTVNGVPAALGDRADPERDLILAGGKALPPAGEKLYIMLNKPRGYVTTLRDEKGRKNVAGLVSGLGTRLYPVGRLDMYSEGLLIMTNDGDFANALMHPSGGFLKTYHTRVKGADIGAALETLSRPMDIDGREVRAASVDCLESWKGGALISVAIAEGRNRQVRKMCAQAGLSVTRLCRVGEGPLKLGDLESGCWRRLTEEELALIRAGKAGKGE